MGTPPDKDGAAPVYEANPRTLVGPIGQAREPGGEIVAIVGLPSPDADWWRPIFECI
jgi:hypothetical protein